MNLKIPRPTHLWRHYGSLIPTYCGARRTKNTPPGFATSSERVFTCNLCRNALALEQVTKRLKK